MRYTITEKQNINSVRDGVTKEFKNLTGAKQYASRHQAFHGTVLTIEDGDTLLAYRDGSIWVDL